MSDFSKDDKNKGIMDAYLKMQGKKPAPIKEQVSKETDMSVYTSAIQQQTAKGEEIKESIEQTPATLADVNRAVSSSMVNIQKSLSSLGGGGIGEQDAIRIAQQYGGAAGSAQELSLNTSTNELSISNGNSVDFTPILGADGVDSAATISLIESTVDSDYVNARVEVTGGTDSAEVVSIINTTVDATYVNNLGISAGTDSAGTISLIQDTVDSDYVGALVSDPIGWKTPQDFGAAGDGVTDDTTAIRDWLQSGGELYAPEGTYLIPVQAGNDGVRATLSGNTNVLCHPNAVFKAGTGLDYDILNIKPNAASYVIGEEISLYWRGGVFDMRLQATSTSVPFLGSFPAAGAGGQGTSGICDGLSIRGQVDDNGTPRAGFRKVDVRQVRVIADDPNNPHWQRSGGDTGIFVAGTIHHDVSDCTFFGCRDLGIYGSGLSNGDTIPGSSATYRNNVFHGCCFGVTMKRNMDNIVMTGNIGINCGGVCAASDANSGTGSNYVMANNIGTNCGYIVNVKLGTDLSATANHSYEHGHLDQNGNEFTTIFNTSESNACVLVKGSVRCDISNNVVHSVDPNITTEVYTVLVTEDDGTSSANNFVYNNTGRQVNSVVKDIVGVAESTTAWGNVGRELTGNNALVVDIDRDAGSVDRDGPIAENYASVSLTGTTATTELRNGVIKAGTLKPGEKIRITASGTVTGTTNSKTIALRCKGLANRGVTFPATASGPFILDIEITAVNTIGGTSGSQIISGTVFCGTDFGTTFAAENTETDLVDYDLRLVGKVFNAADEIEVETFRIEYS